MIQPDTEVRLLSNIPFSNDYGHTRYFTSSQQQTDYFLSKSQYTFLDFTYQREDSSIKVPRAYDDVQLCNYVMYQNKSFSGKWFYAFITKKEYVNPNTTRITIETDVFQTWLFQLKWKPSYVIREHTKRWNADGSPVVNTIDEGLDYGSEYETVSIENYHPYDGVFFLVVIAKETMHSNVIDGDGVYPVINGLPQPLTYYVHPFKRNGTTPHVMLDGEGAMLSPVIDVVKALATQENAVNNIVAMYVTDYIGVNMGYSPQYQEYNLSRNHFQMANIGSVNTLNLWKLENYEPKQVTYPDVYQDYTKDAESKLLMHPYTVTILDDLKGNRLELKNESLKGGSLNLSVMGSIGTSNKVAYTVTNYLDSHPLEVASVNNNPNDLPVVNDYLSAFLQGNRNQIENQVNSMLFNSLTGVMGGFFGGGALGATVGTAVSAGNSLFQIAGLNAKIKDIQNVPASLSSLGGNTAFDYGNGVQGVYIIKKQIKAEHRKRLSQYFKMFGYKVHELKVPNLKTRQSYNFIQMAYANVYGDIPHEDLQRIKTMFEDGVTLWHTSDVGNYDLVNNEL